MTVCIARVFRAIAMLVSSVSAPDIAVARKGKGAQFLHRPRQDHRAATVADFCTAVLIGDRRVGCLLQPSAPALRPWRQNTEQGISRQAISLRPGLTPGPPTNSLVA